MFSWDKQTAEEFAAKFGLEVRCFSNVECGSLEEANSLLKAAGFTPPAQFYYWERGDDQVAITHKNGKVTFRKGPTPQEREEHYEAWVEARRSRQEIQKAKHR